jgi:hemoglobin/transferrin/lactoferrin receptor protein
MLATVPVAPSSTPDSTPEFTLARRNRFMQRVLVRAVALALAAPVIALAQQPATPPKPAQAPQLKEVTVTATRTEKAADEVPATVTVITDADKEKALVTDIRDLVRYEPGISVRNSPSRFSLAGAGTGRDGNAGFSIRGIDGNRVLMQTDGIRLPQAFSFAAQNFGRGDYIDIDLYKTVEIVRGPASALYGSDGLAGAVSFLTKDPDDFVSKDGQIAGSARYSVSSADRSRGR